MPRVLIPSDNRDFVGYLAAAYAARGWDAVVGMANFELMSSKFDLVHFQWPEEFSGWNPPDDARLAEIIARLETWSQRSRLLMTAHNLLPHRQAEHPQFRRLYDAFYQRIPLLAHFTEASRDAIQREFPIAAQTTNIVTGYFNLDALVPPNRDPATARKRFGFERDEFVILVIGGLREWEEVELVRDGFDACRAKRKRLLMCGRLNEAGSSWQRRWHDFTWRRWLHSHKAAVIREFIPDPDVHRVVDAADAVIVPRLRSLNSGIPALAVSFGKITISPRCGSYPELFAGTQHPIYAPGDSEDLATALDWASEMDQTTVEADCARLRESWSWHRIIDRIVTAVGLR